MSDSKDAAGSFLARWSRRKAQVRQGAGATEPAVTPTVRPELVEGPVHPVPVERPAAFESPPPACPSTEPVLSPSKGSTQTVSDVDAAQAAVIEALPTLEDVALLSSNSDFTRYVAPNVTPEVKNAAMKKLFSDPHFNVMDGLDTYIDDYGKPDPIPASMLRQMVQSRALGLFADEEETAADSPAARAAPDVAAVIDAAQSTTELPTPIADDQDAALRLQPLDAAGPPGAASGAGPHAGRQC